MGDAAAPDVVSADAPGADGAADPLLNDCASADYVDRSAGDVSMRTIVAMGTTGYTPRCVRISVGQSIVFAIDFAVHPLSPGVPHGSSVGATLPNPIPASTTGSTATVAFPNAGYYPFYCLNHGHVGMAGVVRVVP